MRNYAHDSPTSLWLHVVGFMRARAMYEFESVSLFEPVYPTAMFRSSFIPRILGLFIPFRHPSTYLSIYTQTCLSVDLHTYAYLPAHLPTDSSTSVPSCLPVRMLAHGLTNRSNYATSLNPPIHMLTDLPTYLPTYLPTPGYLAT